MEPLADEPSRSLSPGGVLLWLLPQTVALSLAAGDVSLWAHHPLPRASRAVDELLVCQMVTSALLFPIVFRSARTTAVCVAALLPFDAAALLLAIAPAAATAAAAFCTAIWCVGLHGWCRVFRTTHLHLSISTATALVLYPLLLTYAHAEVADTPPGGGYLPDPLAGVLAVAHGQTVRRGIWAAVPLAVTAAATGFRWATRRPLDLSHLAPPDPH